MPMAILGDRGVLRLRGEAARGFLNGLVTSEIESLTPGTARYAALLSPQGKILADFFVVDGGAALFLDVPAPVAADLANRLGFYRLRAKVSIDEVSQRYNVAVCFGGTPAPAGLGYDDPRHPALGRRVLVDGPLDAPGAVDEAEWHAHRIALGVPDSLFDFPLGESFPHDADMDQLHGVDFRKGCFIGQEVVSRMQHRGTARTRIVPVSITGGDVSAGEAVMAGDKRIGTMGSSVAGRGLAMLRLDRYDDALKAGEPLIAGAAQLAAHKPDWASFAWPGEGP